MNPLSNVENTGKRTGGRHSNDAVGPEHPLNHFAQAFSAVFFLSIWVWDSFFLHLTAFLMGYISLWMRLLAFVAILIFGLYLLRQSEKLMFKKPYGKEILAEGVYGVIRHPMYMGELMVYFSLVVLTFSLISLIPLAIAFILMDRMATFEEKELEKIFGDAYVEYKNRVSKWIPKKERVIYQ